MVYNWSMFENILIENGFTTKEAALYLSVLEAGELTLARAAENAHLKRSTVYSLVEGLEQRGVLSITKRRGISYVSALSPRLLVEHFERSAEMAKSVLPQLMNLAYTSPVKPRLRFYEGVEGIEQILFEAACSKQDYIGFIDYAPMPKEIYRYIRTKVAPERSKTGITLRLLMPKNETNAKILQEYQEKVEHRMVDFPSRKNHIEILLYEGSKIGCMSYVKNEMFGVVIDSEGIHQTLFDLFTLIWNQTTKGSTQTPF